LNPQKLLHGNRASLKLQFTVPAQARQDFQTGATGEYRLELTLAGSGSVLFLPLAAVPLLRLNQAGFGMWLETPVDSYQRSERSVKYGFLFISLTFFTTR
jgi:hypothetical protein